MNRSRVFYPTTYGSDAGGDAELQTDVMRFMAILSLCLVAIFALVQSIPVVQSKVPPVAAKPLAPEPAPAKPEPQKPVPQKTVVARATPPEPPPPVVHRSVPEPKPAPEPTPVAPARAPLTVAEQAPPAVAQAPREPEQEGFTLQFETDYALTRLVAAHEVGLYAIMPGTALRLSVDNDRAGFWQASLPRQYHEMDASTVPDEIVRALLQSGHSNVGLKWGVTLPAGMTRSLDQLLTEHRGGALIIGTDGILRLEQT